jgi:hypothetical protein
MSAPNIAASLPLQADNCHRNLMPLFQEALLDPPTRRAHRRPSAGLQSTRSLGQFKPLECGCADRRRPRVAAVSERAHRLYSGEYLGAVPDFACSRSRRSASLARVYAKTASETVMLVIVVLTASRQPPPQRGRPATQFLAPLADCAHNGKLNSRQQAYNQSLLS